MTRFNLRVRPGNAEERRGSFVLSLMVAAAVASANALVGCGDSEEPSSDGSGGAEAGQGGGGRGGSGGTAGNARGGVAGDAGDGGSSASGGTGGNSGSSGSNASGGSSSGGTSGTGGQSDGGGAGDGGDGGQDLSECRSCIAENPEMGPVQAEYCDVSEECLSAQNCVLRTGCFLPTPAVCYCGTTDIDACLYPDFIPTGPCVEEIRAGTGDAPDNETVLDRFFDFDYPTGVGLLIVDEASRVCATECFP